MKTLIQVVFSTLILSVVATSASAAVKFEGMGNTYVGTKVGTYDVDKKANDIKSPIAYGVYGGYSLAQGIGVEAEYLTSNKSDVNIGKSKVADASINTMGLYATYRYNFPNSSIYAKAKAGYAKSTLKLDYEVKGAKDTEIDNKGFSGGLGLGFNITDNIAIEGEYSRQFSKNSKDDVEDLNLMSVGAHIKF